VLTGRARLHAVYGYLCYCESVKNITVSVPDEVYREARIRAAERGSSVSALVGEYLRSLAGQAVEFSRLEAQQRQVQATIKRFRASDRLSRHEIHDRAVR
jgi:plasmid stability protein